MVAEFDAASGQVIPLEAMYLVCEYLSTSDIEALRSTCTTMRDYVDATICMLPKKIEECNITVKDETATMKFRINAGYNSSSNKMPNGFTFSSFIRYGWSYQSKDQNYVTISREVDEDLWSSLCEGFSHALFDGISVDMLLTVHNVNGLCGALKSAKFDEFRIAISKFEKAEIGKQLVELIGSRQYTNRELDHLHYALLSFKGDAFELAADFLVSLTRRVPSLEVEYVERSKGWEKLLTLSRFIELQQSECRDIALDFVNRTLTKSDVRHILRLFADSSFPRILRLNLPAELIDDVDDQFIRNIDIGTSRIEMEWLRNVIYVKLTVVEFIPENEFNLMRIEGIEFN